MGPSYAGVLGPLAFVLVVMRGLIDGSSTESVLCMAAACLLIFAAAGYIAGRFADQVVWESVRKQFNDEMQAQESQAKAAE